MMIQVMRASCLRRPGMKILPLHQRALRITVLTPIVLPTKLHQINHTHVSQTALAHGLTLYQRRVHRISLTKSLQRHWGKVEEEPPPESEPDPEPEPEPEPEVEEAPAEVAPEPAPASEE